MARGGLQFLEEASERLSDPSISAGRSVLEKSVTGLRPSKERFQASAKFLERSGRTQTLTSGLPTPDEDVAVEPEVGIIGPSAKKKTGGGFVSFGASKKRATTPVANFGLPTDRLPTIEELGGALGGIARYVSQLTKRNRARGLTPGVAVTKTKDRAGVGLTKAKLSTLAKLHETATLAGDKTKAAEIEAQLNAILQGDEAGAFEESDLAAIESL
jgi:hypothetical protein